MLEIVAVGYKGDRYTREQLKEAFELVSDKTNWKLPLSGVIFEEEFDVVNQATIFFAGSPLSVVRRLPVGKVEVAGAGYYECIGA